MDHAIRFTFAILIGVVSGLFGMYLDFRRLLSPSVSWFLGAMTGIASMLVLFYPLLSK